MRQPQTALLGDNGCCHGRGQVVDNDDGIHLVCAEVIVKLGHHTASQLVQVLAGDAQKDIGGGYLQVAEQCRFQRGVVGSTGIDQLEATVGGVFDGSDEGGNLDEIRSCACENTDIVALHCNRFYVFMLQNYEKEVKKKSEK